MTILSHPSPSISSDFLTLLVKNPVSVLVIQLCWLLCFRIEFYNLLLTISNQQTMIFQLARFLNGLNYPIPLIADFQPQNNLVEHGNQTAKAERQVLEDFTTPRPPLLHRNIHTWLCFFIEIFTYIKKTYELKNIPVWKNVHIFCINFLKISCSIF